MKINKLALAATAAFAFAASAGVARADLIPGGVVDIGGTGFGAVNTVLTYQATGQDMSGPESGCVGVSSSGTLNSIGSSVCQGGNVGGMEKNPAGFPHNQTFMVTDASKIALVFNADQPAGSTITVTNLTLALYNSSGQVGFTSGPFTPVTLDKTQPGIGNSGFVFVLDATQAAAAQAAINGGFNLLGLSSTTAPGIGGPETFFLTTTDAVPEPGAMLNLGLGLAGLALVGIARRKQNPIAA